MTDEYLEEFVRESEERIVELNNSLLALEDDPTDEAAMDEIFRTAHTLKGNCAAMGFEDTSDLAHAIEDLLDEIRQGEMEITAAVMDDIFEGVDRIETALDEIEAHGEASIDAQPTIESIRGKIEGGDATGNDDGDDGTDSESDADGDDAGATDVAGGEGDELPTAAEEGLAALDDRETLAAADAVVHVRAAIEAGEMRGVDGMLAYETANQELGVLASVPEQGAIEAGEFDDGFDLFVASSDPDAVESVVSGIAQIEDAAAVDVTDALSDEHEAAAESDDADAAEGGEAANGDDESGGDNDDGPSSESTDKIRSVRVDVDQLDDLYGQVEQLVTSRIKLRRAVEEEDFVNASDMLDELDKVSADLQGTVMDMRMVPLEKTVNTFPRMVRDIAREQDKEVDFVMEGTDVELDRTILDDISDPLMHVLRNAVDHGIEPPEEREAAGKDPEGNIRLSATRQRDHVEITISDDGGGLDVDALREKARENDVRSEAELERMDDSDVYDLIFHPGFSTADEVTDVSGRGVGMDVVHSTVNRLDGSVNVESTPGEGTTVTLRLPVSIAIVRVLFVGVGDAEYGIPIKRVDEIMRADGAIGRANGDRVVDHEGEVYPVISLADELDEQSDVPDADSMLVRIRQTVRKAVLQCDDVKRQEEVVIKPLEGALSDVPGLGGTAVMGDGDVIPILDVESL